LINDIFHFGNAKLINNYKSGSIALWDISNLADSNSPRKVIKNVHSGFAYKIRKMDDSLIVSSGDDGFAKITDIEKG